MLQIAARACGNLVCLASWPDKETCMPLDGTGPTSRMSRDTGSAVDLLELLTVSDVAALLKVSKSWVYEHTRARSTPRSDQLPHIRSASTCDSIQNAFAHFWIAKRTVADAR